MGLFMVGIIDFLHLLRLKVKMIQSLQRNKMQNDFIKLYDAIDKSKKLNFLKQLLLKDSDLQQQFIQFTADKKADLDSITAIDIEALRDEIWGEIAVIDPDSEVESSCYYNHYENGELGDDLLTAIFNPYTVKAIDFVHKGNYLDAFRIILAIYELSLIETPEIDDNNYFVFNDDLQSYIDGFIFSSIAKLNDELKNKVLSVEMIQLLQKLFFERYAKSAQDTEYETVYNISHFQRFFEQTTDKVENAKSLLESIHKHNVDNAENIVLHIADILEDNTLYIEVANDSFMDNREVALKLQKRYKELNRQSELARVSRALLEKKDYHKEEHALFVIENIDKVLYEALYITALQIYVTSKHSIVHYNILREYLDEHKRLAFIESFKDIYVYNKPFYVQLLEIEKQYATILEFVAKNRHSYDLHTIVKPIVSIYPNEVFDILKAACDKQVNARGRSSYARASQLLQLMLPVPEKKAALAAYVHKLYNHQPRLPALRDELSNAGLLK